MESKIDSMTSARKNILHLIDMHSNGGAEKVMLGTVDGLKEYNHHIICLSHFANAQKSPDVKIKTLNLNLDRNWDDLLWYYLRKFLKIRLSFPVVNYLRFRFSVRKKIEKYVAENNIEVVHAHHFWSQFLSRNITSKKIKVINTIHSQISRSNSFWHKYLEAKYYKPQVKIIAVSQTVLSDYEKVLGRKCNGIVVYNYIEDYFWENKKSTFYTKGDTLKLVCVGRLSPEKNHLFLLNALKQVKLPYLLDIYGDGALKEQLEDFIKSNNLNVRIHAPIQNIEISKKLVDFDLFILPSISEGNPLSLLEAMASKLPSLVSDIPVLKEAGEDFVIYFKLNDPTDFVKQLEKISEGQTPFEKISEKAFDKVKNTAQKARYLDQIESLYNSSF